MPDCLLKKLCFLYNELIKQNETKHSPYLFVDGVKHSTIATFIVHILVVYLGVKDWSRKEVPSPSLNSPTPKHPELPLTLLFYSDASEQLSCLLNEVKDAFLDEIF